MREKYQMLLVIEILGWLGFFGCAVLYLIQYIGYPAGGFIVIICGASSLVFPVIAGICTMFSKQASDLKLMTRRLSPALMIWLPGLLYTIIMSVVGKHY